MIALLIAAALLQDGSEAAREAVRTHREARAKAKTEADLVASVAILKLAAPHDLIRQELTDFLLQPHPAGARIEAADALGGYPKDDKACTALMFTAKNSAGADGTELRRTCIRVFGAVAPFRRSVELADLLSDPVVSIVLETVKAAEIIGSVRMLRSLIDLGGDAEVIKGAADPRRALLKPTMDAINALWKKIDPGMTLRTYPEANGEYFARRKEIRRIIAEEDKSGRKP